LLRERSSDYEQPVSEEQLPCSNPIAAVLRLRRRTGVGRAFSTYRLIWGERPLADWSCESERFELKMLIALCEQLGIPVYGHELPYEDLVALTDGTVIPAEVLRTVGIATWTPTAHASLSSEVLHGREEWVRSGGVRERYLGAGLPHHSAA
jgi:hypothetical protein